MGLLSGVKEEGSKAETGSNTRGINTPLINSPKLNKQNTNTSETSSVRDINGNRPFEYLDERLAQKIHKVNSLNLTPFEIQKILSDYFLKPSKNDQEKSKLFKKLLGSFSEIIFSSSTSLIELNELNDLKIALNIRYKGYLKYCKTLESENSKLKEDLEKFNLIKEKIHSLELKKTEEEKKNYILVEESTKLKANLAEANKKVMIYKTNWNESQAEFFRYKTLLVQEFRSLRFDLMESNTERDLLRKEIKNFMEFCEKHNIHNSFSFN